jgi:hypothetical protein
MKDSEPAGKFPLTVDLYQPTVGTADDFGHKPKSHTQVGQAAARIWTATTSGTNGDAADLVQRRPQLLLKEPISGIEIGWRIMWRGRLYSVDATDERGVDLLVTLSPASRT